MSSTNKNVSGPPVEEQPHPEAVETKDELIEDVAPSGDVLEEAVEAGAGDSDEAPKDASNEEKAPKEDPLDKYSLSAEDLRTIGAQVSGELDAWNEDYSGEVGGLWVGKATPDDLRAALTAVADDLLQKATVDAQAETELYGLYKSDVFGALHDVGRLRHQGLLYQNHRVFVDKDSFDSNVHLSVGEQRTALNSASAWTLWKALHAQILAGVNRCFARHSRDLPIEAMKSAPKANNAKDAKLRVKSKGDGPKSRAPEEAVWRGMADANLLDDLYTIQETHNRLLKHGPNLSEYYRHIGWLRRQERKTGKDANGFTNVGSKSGSRSSRNSRVLVYAFV